MSHQITIEMSDRVFEALAREASSLNTTPAVVAASALERQFSNGPAEATRTSEEQRGERRGFQSVFGIVSLPNPIGLNNEQIDADLAREYGDSHEGR